MQRRFNITGACDSKRHFMVDITHRLDAACQLLRALIELAKAAREVRGALLRGGRPLHELRGALRELPQTVGEGVRAVLGAAQAARQLA